MSIDAVLKLAVLYAGHSGLKLSTVSTYAAGDGKFFGSLQSGVAGCTFRRVGKVTAWFSDNWPSDLEWPRDIPRPSKPKSREAA
ncbi:hypothetical protein [Paracoccus sp. (in: a-proteobacteria)]|uniref:hypothetical protein n=1 Tax=Paracoccus sp. TaxID=267 RepID=UPI00272A2A67|nr:hypothetical protein [Paracoccus sp. (in: a-proteobacteria)]